MKTDVEKCRELLDIFAEGRREDIVRVVKVVLKSVYWMAIDIRHREHELVPADSLPAYSDELITAVELMVMLQDFIKDNE